MNAKKSASKKKGAKKRASKKAAEDELKKLVKGPKSKARKSSSKASATAATKPSSSKTSKSSSTSGRTSRPTRKAEDSSNSMADDPTTVGEIADALLKLRDTRLELSRTVDELTAEETRLKAIAVTLLAESKQTKGSGMFATVANKPFQQARTEDWDAVHSWALEAMDCDIFEKRLSQKHLRDLTEDGVDVNGVYFHEVDKVSVTRLGKK